MKHFIIMFNRAQIVLFLYINLQGKEKDQLDTKFHKTDFLPFSRMRLLSPKRLNYSFQEFDFLITLSYFFLLCPQLFHVQLKYLCTK